MQRGNSRLPVDDANFYPGEAASALQRRRSGDGPIRAPSIGREGGGERHESMKRRFHSVVQAIMQA
jgi:hypothetical protein